MIIGNDENVPFFLKKKRSKRFWKANFLMELYNLYYNIWFHKKYRLVTQNSIII